MSTARRFCYLRKKDSITTTSLSGEVDSMFFTESTTIHNNNNNILNEQKINEEILNKTTDNEVDNDDSELMPCTPNSIDRSSVGSIPWADDAIKQNQLYWERIERILAGEEQPLAEETDLAQEVQEWRQKFKHLLSASGKRTRILKVPEQNYDNSFDLDALSELSFDYSLNDDMEAGEETLKYSTNVNNALSPQKSFYYTEEQQQPIRQAQRMDSVVDLAQLLSRDLRISSVPLTWRQVKYAKNETSKANYSKDQRSELSTTPTNSPTLAVRPPPRRQSPTFNSLIIAPAKPKMPPPLDRNTNYNQTAAPMPPVLNVLESKRRFRGLANNRSFVQLTAAKQTKSAALTQMNSGQAGQSQRNAWRVPLAAATVGKRFFNQRNSVILPSINLRRINEHRITEVPSSASSTSSIARKGLNSLQNYNMKVNYEPAYNMTPQYVLPAGRSSFSSTTPSTSGRSISAAVHHPRFELNAFYLPYSAATKFKSFNKI